MELMERFSPLMSEALHCSGSAEGLALPLEEIQRRLVETAEQERSAVPLSANDTLPDFSDVRRRELEMCRLAVYAWADEVMLHSPRPDAMSWMPLSLQCRYFHTTEGGQLFFTRLTGLLDDMGIAADEEDGEGGTDDIAVRLEAACRAAPSAPGADVLRVFALCLLYGFQGRLYGRPETLSRVRKACWDLISMKDRPLKAPAPALAERRDLRHVLEPAAYVLVPLVVVAAFGLYCADILSNIPVKGF